MKLLVDVGVGKAVENWLASRGLERVACGFDMSPCVKLLLQEIAPLLPCM